MRVFFVLIIVASAYCVEGTETVQDEYLKAFGAGYFVALASGLLALPVHAVIKSLKMVRMNHNDI